MNKRKNKKYERLSVKGKRKIRKRKDDKGDDFVAGTKLLIEFQNILKACKKKEKNPTFTHAVHVSF